MTKYQVIYEGQILTDPMSFQGAIDVAIGENISAFEKGHLPACEVTIAPINCSQCTHFVSTEPFEDSDGQCARYMGDLARSDDPIATICKGYRSIAPAKTCSQCAHFVSFATTSAEQCDGACFLLMDSAGSSDPIATICKGYRASAIVEVES